VPPAQVSSFRAATAVAPAQTPIVAQPVIEALDSKQEKCRTCGHLSKPGSERCEACGAPVGAYARKLKVKKVAIAAAVVIGVLLVGTGAAAAGWYALGIKLAVQTDPSESKIVIDGQEVGKTNSYGSLTTSRIRAGDHTLIVTRDGFDEWRQSFNIAFTDLSKSLNIKLNATKYKLTVVSSPAGSEVLVDNNSMGNTNDANGTLETAPLAPGEHTVLVKHDGYRDWKQTVKLSGDQKVDVTLTSAPVIDANSGSADSEIRNALEGWAQSSRNRDVDAHVRYYADTLDFYYNRTMVPSAKIREDRTKAFAKFNQISIQLTNMNVQLDSTGQRATVTLDKTFDFRGDNNSFWNGSVQDLIAVTKLGGAWLITGEKELKVYYVNK
jgi:ketosteroid isomerase-like protein